MELTIGNLKKIMADLPDETLLATLEVGNDRFRPFSYVKRLLLLRCMESGKEYLTINGMGSHFTQEGDQKKLIYTSLYWDEDNINPS